jgi:hypothetical protein
LGLAESSPEDRLRFRTGVRDLVDVGGVNAADWSDHFLISQA